MTHSMMADLFSLISNMANSFFRDVDVNVIRDEYSMQYDGDHFHIIRKGESEPVFAFYFRNDPSEDGCDAEIALSVYGGYTVNELIVVYQALTTYLVSPNVDLEYVGDRKEVKSIWVLSEPRTNDEHPEADYAFVKLNRGLLNKIMKYRSTMAILRTEGFEPDLMAEYDLVAFFMKVGYSEYSPFQPDETDAVCIQADFDEYYDKVDGEQELTPAELGRQKTRTEADTFYVGMNEVWCRSCLKHTDYMYRSESIASHMINFFDLLI